MQQRLTLPFRMFDIRICKTCEYLWGRIKAAPSIPIPRTKWLTGVSLHVYFRVIQVKFSIESQNFVQHTSLPDTTSTKSSICIHRTIFLQTLMIFSVRVAFPPFSTTSCASVPVLRLVNSSVDRWKTGFRIVNWSNVRTHVYTNT